MHEPTDDEADAAQIAFEEWVHGHRWSSRRELGFNRQGWKVALIAAHEWRHTNG